MLRSLFSGVSGLRTHQTMMDVVGNNIANVNTAGYKSSQTIFEDTLSQMIKAAGGPQNGNGGSNPAQVGLGVRLAGITTNFAQGASQLTGRATDLAIQGDGFFQVKRDADTLYTRAGGFSTDSSGLIVTPDGSRVQGWMAAADGTLDTTGAPVDLQLPLPGGGATPGPNGPLQSYTIAPDGTIVGVFNNGLKQNIGQIALATFSNPAGLEKVGGSLYRTSVNSGTPQVGAPATGGRGSLASGTLEMSNVDLAQEFTNLIVAQRGFQANTKVITSSDEILQDLVNLKR